MIKTNDAVITETEARFMMTPQRKAQVFGSIQECERILAKERRYPEDLQNKEYISRYEAVKARLIGYLDEVEKTGWFTAKGV